MSIITPEAMERCAQEAAHREHLQALCALEIARASKRIHDHYAVLMAGGEPEQLGRRIFDRRAPDVVMRPARPIQRSPSDMRDIELHLSADAFRDAQWIEP